MGIDFMCRHKKFLQRLFKFSGLTLPVNGQHNRSVIGMQMEEDWGANQVLGEVPEERDRSDTHKPHDKSIFRTYSSEVQKQTNKKNILLWFTSHPHPETHNSECVWW